VARHEAQIAGKVYFGCEVRTIAMMGKNPQSGTKEFQRSYTGHLRKENGSSEVTISRIRNLPIILPHVHGPINGRFTSKYPRRNQ
jgi:hypothetical protein